MAKVVLGKRPASFKRIVSFPMLDGTKGAIEVTYRYRTRVEYGKFIDDWRKLRQELLAEEEAERQRARDAAVKAAEEAGQEPPPHDFSTADAQERITAAAADFIMEIAEGWNVEGSDFTRENVVQLANELPAAAAAIQDTYLLAITEGRLGN